MSNRSALSSPSLHSATAWAAKTLRLACLAAVVVPGVMGCRPLLKSLDEGVEVGRRMPTSAPRAGRGFDMPSGTSGWTKSKALAGHAVQMTVSEALSAAADAGVAPDADAPDLTGHWQQTDHEDGVTIQQEIERGRRREPGTYDFADTLSFQVDGTTMMTVEMSGIEVIDTRQQCQYIQTVSVRYASEGIRDLFGEMETELVPAELNKEPCGGVTRVTASSIEGHQDGSPWKERRRR